MTKHNRNSTPMRKSSTSLWCGSPGHYRLPSNGTIQAAYIGKNPRSYTRRNVLRQRPNYDRASEPVESTDEQDDQNSPNLPMDDSFQSESSQTAVDQLMHDSDVPDVFYQPDTPEVPETCDLEVYGELPPEADDEESIPVRALSDFTIYKLDDKELVPFEVLCSDEDVPRGIGASGIVAAWIDDGEDLGVVEDEEELCVALTEILEVSLNHVNDEAGDRDVLDEKIYIRTQHAWYILDVPSGTYASLFAEFWTKHHIFHLLVASSLEDSELDYPKFVEILDNVAEQEAEKLIGRQVTVSDFTDRDTRSFITRSLRVLCGESDDFRRLLDGVPLIEQVYSRIALGSGTAKRVAVKTQSRFGDEFNRTVVTYRILQYARGLFVQPMQVVGNLPSDAVRDPSPPPATFAHPDNHSDVHWDLDSGMGPMHYQSVLIDGVQYKMGDSVIIIAGQDVNDSRNNNAKQLQSRSSNRLANTKWFAKICYFFEDKDKKYFHAQWYQHGSQILLQETAHSQHLFLINECDDLDLNCIYQKCNLKVLGPTDEEPLPELNFEENDFYTGLTWDQDDACFLEITPEEHRAATEVCDPWQPCYVCGLVKLEQAAARWTPLIDGGMSHLNVAYHLHDFVYLRPSTSGDSLYQIAQIVEFYEDKGEWSAHLRLFGRHSLLAKSSSEDEVADDRRLYMTSTVLYCRPLNVVDGKSFVVHSGSLTPSELEAWVEHDDHYYLDSLCNAPDPKSLKELTSLPLKVVKFCEKCMTQHLAATEEASSLLKKHGPLRGLELFAGAGGLSTGFNATGYVQTKWAVEYIPQIAHTYCANHPGTIVYNQDSNALLRHAVHTFEGKNPPPLRSRRPDKSKELPPLPMPGEVDFIYGGPPCQSFSEMNHNKRDDDPRPESFSHDTLTCLWKYFIFFRSTMPCNMLSYVEFYRPQYFLLENVKGMVHFKLAKKLGKDDGSAVKFGVIKFILRSLVGLGYQARFRVLQAGQYGAPQGRNRVIFWGARRDVPLPKFPVPTHFFEPVAQFNLPTGDKLRPPTRTTWLPGEAEPYYHQCAPMPAVTALDAISDLTPFDWINPHLVIPRTAEDTRVVNARKAQGIIQRTAVKDNRSYAGFEDSVCYAKKPLNRYQLFMRKEMRPQDKVKYHYSRRFNALVVERVLNIPLEPKANHKCLPLQLACTANNGAGYNTLYMRISRDGHFNTALTTVNPAQKGGSVLHPTQKRIVTVRECARSQGFPDHYQFLSLHDSLSVRITDQLRQIGNAVPIPLGMALGKELGKALVQMWKKEDQHVLEERNASPEVEMID